MMQLLHIIIFGIALVTTYFGIEIFRRWTLKRGLFDVPNERSSHSVPTPRGGGLIIVAVSLFGYIAAVTITGARFSWGYFAGAILIALISWLDDLFSISFGWRLLVHISAAILLVFDVGFIRSVAMPFPVASIELGYAGAVLTVIWVVWLVNAYNFMDGIDGIAGLQAVIAAIGWTVFAWIFDYPAIYLYSGLIGGACIGFLIHNWHPAKIFMGDVGSAFLGFTFAALPLLAFDERPGNSQLLTNTAVVLVWFFLFDTVLTFATRLIRGKKVWEAHRDHLYQKMVISGMRHSTVTLIYGSAAAILAAAFIFEAEFAGNFRYFALFSCIILTILIIFVAYRKVSIDLST
jgi:Fuc2NAc and GlcNAc transferase